MLRHTRLWISGVAIGLTFFVLPAQWTVLSRVLVSWDCGVALFLLLIFRWMMGLSASQICEHFSEEEQTALVILTISIVAAFLSLVAIVAFLSTVTQASSAERAAHFALAAVTVLVSWILVPTTFTLHYADMFYRADADHQPLLFPGTSMPLFMDFAYFSFTIAAACQTADVSTTAGTIRKVVGLHSVLSFLFNAAILGFAINVTAGFAGKL
jgi:uncharacterized membrane protein